MEKLKSLNINNIDNGEMNNHHKFPDYIDSACSTPYVSAPSSPCRGGFFYSAPSSPLHYILSTTSTPTQSTLSTSTSFEFDFAGLSYTTNDSESSGAMSSADELFLDGKIRPMKLSSHLQRPQILAPLIDSEQNNDANDNEVKRGRDSMLRADRSKSLRRRTRSMSPFRTSAFQWLECIDNEKEAGENNEDKHSLESKQNDTVETESETPASSSVGRNSKRWVFLKEFLYRSKSEGRSSSNNTPKFWSTISLTPTAKDNKKTSSDPTKTTPSPQKESGKKAMNGMSGKRRVTRSAHEIHYAANRAQSEEMRRRTYLPYRQGVLGCLGFSSKSYGAMNGFARALNPVSSR